MSPGSPPSVEALKNVLRRYKRRSSVVGESRLTQAAVAAIFRQRTELELLMIRRAEHPRDPWSGHMAFPGGRVDASDAGPLSAAVRETKEELALDLDHAATLVGELSHVPAIAKGKRLPMVIYPFVFELNAAPVLEPDSREVEEALWVPFSFLLEPSNRSSIKKKIGGVPLSLPAYHYEGRMIWGLTLQMIDEIRKLLERRPPPVG